MGKRGRAKRAGQAAEASSGTCSHSGTGSIAMANVRARSAISHHRPKVPGSGSGVPHPSNVQELLRIQQQQLQQVLKANQAQPISAPLPRKSPPSGNRFSMLLSENADSEPPQRAPAAAASTAAASDGLPPFSLPRWVLLYDPAELQRVISAQFAKETVVGLDIEWKPTFVKGQPENPVALIQLATARIVVLVPVKHLRALPPALVNLLSSPAVWKVGCGVTADAQKLSNEYGLEVRSVCELGPTAMRLQTEEAVRFPKLGDGELVGQGLKSMAAALGQALEKPKRVTRSNWESRPLSMPQQRYAAQDAYVSYWLALCCNHLHARARGKTPDVCAPMGCWVEGQVAACQKWNESRKQALAASKASRKRQKQEVASSLEQESTDSGWSSPETSRVGYSDAGSIRSFSRLSY